MRKLGIMVALAAVSLGLAGCVTGPDGKVAFDKVQAAATGAVVTETAAMARCPRSGAETAVFLGGRLAFDLNFGSLLNAEQRAAIATAREATNAVCFAPPPKPAPAPAASPPPAPAPAPASPAPSGGGFTRASFAEPGGASPAAEIKLDDLVGICRVAAAELGAGKAKPDKAIGLMQALPEPFRPVAATLCTGYLVGQADMRAVDRAAARKDAGRSI